MIQSSIAIYMPIRSSILFLKGRNLRTCQNGVSTYGKALRFLESSKADAEFNHLLLTDIRKDGHKLLLGNL